MLDLAAFPAELFDSVLECLNSDESTLPHLLRPQQKLDRVENLRACSLVSHSWHSRCTRKLYSEFQSAGDRHSFSVLWRFLRTVMERPDLGALVKHLDLRECEYEARSRDTEYVNAQEQERRIQEMQALLDTGCRIGYTRRQLYDALHEEFRQPFAIILINRLPNVSALYYSPAVRRDPYDWFCNALTESRMLHKLENATLFGNPFGKIDVRERDPSYWIKDAEQLFHLPSLRRLALLSIEIASMRGLLDKKLSRTSRVTHLTIVPGGDFRFLSTTCKESLKACLQLPKALLSLTLHMPRRIPTGANGEDSPNYMISSDYLWDILSSYRNSLDYLEIYDRDALFRQPRSKQKSHLGLLSGFERLRTLRIQPELLLGGMNGIVKAPFRLRQTLPVSICSLTFYNFNYPFKELEEQLIGLMCDPAFLKLRFLFVQDTPNNNLSHLSSRKVDKNTPLWKLCHDRNVRFRPGAKSSLPEGGRNLLSSVEAYDPERHISEMD